MSVYGHWDEKDAEGAGMLEETLVALAAAGGASVVQAAGTDAWVGLRTRVARVLGRGEAQHEGVVLERLDQTAAALEAAGPAEAEQVRITQEGSWQASFAVLLESLTGDERARVAAELGDLVGRPGRPATYAVDAREARGVMTGEGNTQHNDFRGSSANG